MVEKISEVNVNTALNSDSVSDDSVLLEWMDKKKKQNRQGEQPSSATVTAQMLVQVLNGTFTGGGWQQKENKRPTTEAGLKPVQPSSISDDGLRRKVILAASSRMEAPLTTSDKPAVAVASTKESDASPRAAIVPGKQVDATATSLPVAVGVRRAETPVISQPTTPLSLQNNEGTSRQLGSNLQPKDELNEEKPVFAPGRTLYFRANVQSEPQVQSKNVPATLQQLKGQVNAATAAQSVKEAQATEMNYSFQRWTGDHSVKVTIPGQALREGNMTLLPSDTRAADALSRNLGTLAGHSPELLQPRQDRDEQQKREQHPQQDEEQE